MSHCQRFGLALAGLASTIFDLGTSSSPGANVVSDNQLAGLDEGNLWFSAVSPILISAIGNTWDPNTQGTDASGQCSVSGPGQSFDLTTAHGPNFVSADDNQAILRLAESAP
jgi:hypothetical protein